MSYQKDILDIVQDNPDILLDVDYSNGDLQLVKIGIQWISNGCDCCEATAETDSEVICEGSDWEKLFENWSMVNK